MRPPSMTLVVTHGEGSMDQYAQRLGDILPVPRVQTDVYARSARLFGLRDDDAAVAGARRADQAFEAVLRAVPGPVHLPNQHLGRYAHAARGPVVITVHDVMRLFDLEHRAAEPLIAFPNERDAALLRRDYAGVRRADAVIVPSRATRADVIEHLGVEPGRVHVVPEDVDHDVFAPTGRRLYEFPYVLFVGSEQPRKNLPMLVRALARLVGEDPRARDLRFVKVGPSGNRAMRFRDRTVRAIEEAGMEDRVVFSERMSMDDLVAAYCGAACLALPSLYEGFGLPPLEAMACGCPVVASTAGSLPEVTGDAALQVAPRDEAGLAAAIGAVLDPGVAAAMRARGRARAARFTRRRTAGETLRVYRLVTAPREMPAAGRMGAAAARTYLAAE